MDERLTDADHEHVELTDYLPEDCAAPRPGVYVEEVTGLYPDVTPAGAANLRLPNSMGEAVRREQKKLIADTIMGGAGAHNDLAKRVEQLANGELDKKDALLAASHGVLERHNKQLLEELERKNEFISRLEQKLERAHERIFKLSDLVYNKWMRNESEGPGRIGQQAPAREEPGASETADARDDDARRARAERGTGTSEG